MKPTLLLAAALLLWSAAPVQAQRKSKAPASAATDIPLTTRRLQPLFGGLSPAQAEQLVGAPFLTNVAGSFASRAEASRFFSTKGYEYLAESQADTATYRFNLAWVLDPANPDAYRGLGIVASRGTSPEQAIDLLTRGLALAPDNTLLLSDLGTSYLIRYGQSKKKKDLTTGIELLEKATTQDATNAVAWQQLGRGYYYQEKYDQAWAAVHKGQSASLTSIDFDLISDLLTHQPDPQGKFK
ncbi:hypothetical protein K3G63_14275 [Hymenobacter sp. HSC-4F20]|uniref:hypothetical protein n=1 Tax=Hymenobacter sp. HSC-4F20 TaxID=2864135 RepID=UPI001C730094|nr:hypothetical protein [Hymenobacter sp. HSC-4F20]MBX0291613.1 hypothetical protein [Hymenobacter sp. HSC-4F20]